MYKFVLFCKLAWFCRWKIYLTWPPQGMKTHEIHESSISILHLLNLLVLWESWKELKCAEELCPNSVYLNPKDKGQVNPNSHLSYRQNQTKQPVSDKWTQYLLHPAPPYIQGSNSYHPSFINISHGLPWFFIFFLTPGNSELSRKIKWGRKS